MSVRRHLKQFASESLVYGLSGIVSRFLSIWLVPIYTRLLTPEDYGVLSLVTTTMALVGTFVVLALDSAAYRWYWDTDDEAARRRTIASWAWCQLVLSTVVAALVWTFADQLGRWVTDRTDTGLYFRILALTLPVGTFQIVATGWLRLQRRPWMTVAVVLGGSIFQIALTLALVAGLRWGVRGIFIGQLAATVLIAAIGLALLRGWVAPRHVELARLRAMLGYALPLVPAGLAMWIVGSSDRYFIQHYVSTRDVGLYSIGSSIAAVVALATGAFQQAWGPFALSIHREPSARRTYANVFLGYVILTAAAVAGLSLLAPQAILLLATEQYLGASRVVGLMAMTYVAIGMTYIASIGFAIAKAPHHNSVAIGIAALLTIGLNFLLVPRFGMVGSATATLVGQSVAPIYLFARSHRLYPVEWPYGRALAAYALALGLAAVGETLLPVRGWGAVAIRLALFASFVPAVVLLGVIPREHLLALLRSGGLARLRPNRT